MTPSEILAHEIKPGLEEFERRTKRVGDGQSGWRHSGITRTERLLTYCTAFGRRGAIFVYHALDDQR